MSQHEPLPAAANRVHYPALNGLRALAVTLVFCFHYFKSVVPKPLLWGWVGVDIFFVLSGFLITGILLDTVDSPTRFRDFYMRRTLRIFPLYFALSLVVILLTPVFHWQWSKAWLLWPAYLGNYGAVVSYYTHPGNYDAINYLPSRTSGFSLVFIHFWSLCVEEQFYVVWPWVVFTLRRASTVRTICVLGIVATIALRTACYFVLPEMWVRLGILHSATPFRMDSFLMGGLIAALFRGHYSSRMKEMATPLLVTSMGVLVLTWVVAATVLHQGWEPAGTTPWIDTIGFTLIALAATGLLLLALEPGTLIYRALTIRWIARLGEVSYGFYLFHDIPAELYARWARQLGGSHFQHIGVLVGPLAFVCTLLLALLSFHFFEKPFLQLKSRFTS